MQKVTGIIFLISWLLCGCSIDSICDDWRAMLAAVVALIVIILCAMVLSSYDD